MSSFLLATIVSMLLLALSVFLAARAQSSWGRHGSLALLLALIASIPVWGSFLFILIESFKSNSQDFWSVAPWVIIIATFRYLGSTITIALMAAAAYFLIPGQPNRKLLIATLVSVILLGTLAWNANDQRIDTQEAHRMSVAEAAAVGDFVRGAPELVKLLTPPVETKILRNINRDGVPIRYAVNVVPKVAGQRSIIVIVDVDRKKGSARYTWTCTAHEYQLYAWEQQDPCIPSR